MIALLKDEWDGAKHGFNGVCKMRNTQKPSQQKTLFVKQTFKV